MLRFFRHEYAKVLFSSDYIFSVPCIGCDRLLDLNRYKNIKDLLIKEKILKTKNILRPELCSNDELRLVHTDAYLKKLGDNQYLSEILKIGSHLARAPLNALKRSKKLIKNSYSNRLHEHLIEEAKYIKECAGTLDFKEGISAFVEKRYPSFKNK